MYEKLVKRLREHNGWALTETLDEAADAIEELQRQIDGWIEQERKALLKSVPKWVSVTERLPRDRQFVLVYCGDDKRIRPSDRFDVAILLGDSIFTSLGVTHWMPLPEPPKEDKA